MRCSSPSPTNPSSPACAAHRAAHGCGGRTIDGDDGILEMPWVEYSDEVDRLVQALHEVHAIVEVESIELDIARQMVTCDPGNVTETVHMISTVIRADRFSEGLLLRSLQDGTLPVLVRRLANWYRAQA